MSIARINTKYGSIRYYLKIVDMLRKIGKCRILFDIKGLKMINWLKMQDFDYLAVSFADTTSQIKRIRKLFSPKKIKIISKIETKKGIININRLIEESDGIMVARGDLGDNISFERVPIAQKLIIKNCNKNRKMVITATEMLLSMTDSKTPERAEASDIANAVLDGSDALMLSEETAIGKYPALAVKTMNIIIRETEKKKNLLK
ncbi:pyruvate kinase [Candidatus Woesearchaeota archaeon]|nr:pyruvate kinase [Candidatus Woesearchaeota archaeon]